MRLRGLLRLGGLYSSSQYSGDGAITHNDTAWCEYIIELPPINVMADDGEHRFQFSGCPKKTMHVDLILADRATGEHVLQECNASVKAQLIARESNGLEHVVFTLEGPLVNDRSTNPCWFGGSPFVLPPSWKYSEQARQAAWSYGAGWYRFDPRHSYTLVIATDVTDDAPGDAVLLTPVIWGGGFMQPQGLAEN